MASHHFKSRRGLSLISRKFGAAVLVVAAILSSTLPGWTAERQVVKGHVPPAVAGMASTGRLDASRQLHLAISLPLRNRESLNKLLQQVYDPASPAYHHFLTPEEFTEAFGPTKSDYQAVIDFAKASGFDIKGTSPNRVLLEVGASVADIEKAFHVNMKVYQHPTERRSFYSPDAEPSLDLNVPVLSIAGMNDFMLPHPASLHASRTPRPQNPRPQAGSEDGLYVGQDFRSAYVPGVSLNGAGQSLGLAEFDTYYTSDVTDYVDLAAAGLGGSSVTLSNVVLGNVGTPGEGEVEVVLDIDMAISMAPGLSTVYVYEAPNNNSYVDVVLNAMVTNVLSHQLSCSWAGFYDAGVEQAFMEMDIQGQSFFQACGDGGAYFPAGNPVVPPCDDTNITIVGGTTLSTSGPKGSWVSEKSWNWFTYQPEPELNDNATAGGISPTYPLPDWQAGVNMSGNQGSTNYRNIPDVAMAADGVYIIANNGNGYYVGGTSCAAPLWAGFTALVNQQHAAQGQPPQGFMNPALYAIGEGPNYASCFHDITTGNNTNYNVSGNNNTNNVNYTESFTNATLFFTAPGFDLCTGWGTPGGSNLISELTQLPLLAIIPANGVYNFFNNVGSGTLGGPFITNTVDFILTNTGTGSITWSLSNAAPWLDVSLAAGVLGAGQSTNLNFSLVGTGAAWLSGGTTTAEVAVIDATDDVTQSLQFSVSVTVPELVTNGTFATANFYDWNLTRQEQEGYPPPILVVNPTSFTNIFGNYPSSTISSYIYSGAYSALLGTPSNTVYLTQALDTVPGQPYVVSLWLANPGLIYGDGVIPNDFLVQWNGANLFAQTNLGTFPWTNLQYIVTATNAASVLKVGARNDSDYFAVDNITVQPVLVPEFTQAAWTNGSVTLSWFTEVGLSYQLQYTTNLPTTNWINLGAPIPASSGLVITNDVLATNSQRFYQLILLP